MAEPSPGAQAWWDHLADPGNCAWTDEASGRGVVVSTLWVDGDSVSFLAQFGDGAMIDDFVIFNPPILPILIAEALRVHVATAIAGLGA